MEDHNRKCRFCSEPLNQSFADLGMSPMANEIIKPADMHKMEAFYPLHAYVCNNCHLVQLEEFESPDHIFSDYSYFSSFSESWLAHAKKYADYMTERFGINKDWHVVELASNDGYLLKNFVKNGVSVTGVEPAANVAKVAVEAGIPSVVKFFGKNTAKELLEEGKGADLLLGNNVLAHVPDLNDFVGGMKILLKPNGIITMEFPHLLNLFKENQFDTIYHEHFSYFSFITVEKVFKHHGIVLFDVDQLPTHGGSLRIFGKHEDDDTKEVTDRVANLRQEEIDFGFTDPKTYDLFAEQVRETKRKLLEFLIKAKREGKSIVGYGAAAKGNTLLNYCGIRSDFLDYTVDLSPHKQNHGLPGTHVPIMSPDKILETKPDYVLILPWNLRKEIMNQMSEIREWGGKFVVPIPEVKVFE